MAQISDTHVGGPISGSGERLSLAVSEINSMGLQPDLVLLTGDLTHDGSSDQWSELKHRLAKLNAPWEVIPGNHDGAISEIAGHRAIDAGPVRLVLVDTSNGGLDQDDAEWLDSELSSHSNRRVVIAIHHPPFETGIWWMDCVGLVGIEVFEGVVRGHANVEKVLSGHIHRLIQTNWGSCSLWVCPSTYVSVVGDLDPNHDPAESAEGPTFSLHAFTSGGVISHLIPAGAEAKRQSIGRHAPDFIESVRKTQALRPSSYK
ncbi:MAG: hypothetical protein GXP35_13085 [Actinobacteria bacterium]|nr:hypothetical protein [Actinomycetota bacterium]